MRQAPELRGLDETYRTDITRAWELVERRFATLPDPVAALAWRFLHAKRPAGTHREYFSNEQAAPILYLPLWMREALRRSGGWPEPEPPAFIDDLLCATMWGYFYIRIQDDALDEHGPDQQAREALLFGNICVHEMSRRFDAAAGGAPTFHAIFERAWTAFTRWTLEERAQLLSEAPYPRERFEAHAAKVAFAEVPLMAVCLRAGRGELEPVVSELVHALGVAYGLLNDVRGFARDMSNGQRTYLLARAGWSRGAAGGGDGAVPEELRARLYEGGLLGQFLDEARGAFQRAAQAARALGMEPEYERFRARQEHQLKEVERRLLTVSLLRAVSSRE